MIRFGGRPSPEVRALLERERAIPPQPASVRARALARARAISASASKPAAPVSAGALSRRRWAGAAALLCVLGAAVGAAAYQIRVRLAPLPSNRLAGPTVRAAAPVLALSPSAVAAPVDASVPAPARAAVSSATVLRATVLRATVLRATVLRAKAEAGREELPLLRQARAAVAQNDFAAALPPLVEHARRFKDGSLAEEREALRVKALAGLGRIEEARREAAAFGARFPRSVLLPAVHQMVDPRTP
jgi:hypothetical protein